MALATQMAPRRRTFATVCLLALIALGGVACSNTPQASTRGQAGDPISVKTFTVAEETVSRRVQAVGSLFPLEESTISSQVEGRVDAVLAEVGDSVREGQVLVAINPTELQFDVERQRGAVSQVRARLGLNAGDPLPSKPDEVAFVRRAQATLQDVEAKHKRAEQLHRDQLISQQELDESQARYKGARAAYEEAVQEVENLKAQLQSSEAARKLAEKKLSDASIRAPFPGAIKERRVSPGEFLRVQSPVAVIVRTDRLRARLQVPEKWAGSLKVGETVDLNVEAYPNETFRGRLERISPSVSAETRTFEVEAMVLNPGDRLKPGFFLRASMPSDFQEKIRTLPQAAVIYRYGSYKVFVLNGNQVQEREIKTGTQQQDKIEVLEGLRAGDRVAVAVQGDLHDGATVKE